MAKKNKETSDILADLLVKLPWWVSVCVGAIGSLAFIIIAPQMPWAAIIFAITFVFIAALSAFESARKRRILDKQSSIESIRLLGWMQFEELLGEAYRRQGYSVKENSSAGPDGGIDLTIKRDGRVYLVQCKQWRTSKVGVKIVREMLGLVTAHQAQGSIIVTSGTFTKEASAFAEGKPLELVAGHQLVSLIGSVQKERQIAASDAVWQTDPIGVTSTSVQPIVSAPRCPRCDGELVLRKARKGSSAGKSFWGCSGFPKCRYSEAYEG